MPSAHPKLINSILPQSLCVLMNRIIHKNASPHCRSQRVANAARFHGFQAVFQVLRLLSAAFCEAMNIEAWPQ